MEDSVAQIEKMNDVITEYSQLEQIYKEDIQELNNYNEILENENTNLGE